MPTPAFLRLFCLFAALVSVGFADNTERAALKSFRAHMLRLEPVTETSYGSKGWEDVKYDVRRTDSIVTPYKASLSAVFVLTGKPDKVMRIHYSARLAYSDEVWRMDQITIRFPDVPNSEEVLEPGSELWTKFADQLGLNPSAG